jgi:hypothetical protein
MCVNEKVIPVEAIPGMWGEEGTKENDEGGDFKDDIFDTL